MSTSKPPMHDTLDVAFKSQARLNEAIADDTAKWDTKTKTSLRKEVNGLKRMMVDVLKFEKDVTKEVIEGMEKVIEITEAKLDGKTLPAETDYSQAA